MSNFENPDPNCIVNGKPVARKHHEAQVQAQAGNAMNTPMRHRIVYVDVVLPTGTTRIFGILHAGNVYTKVSAFAPTGVSPNPKLFTALSDRDYNVYKQWLQTKSKSKTRRTAEQMQYVESNAENLISDGKEREKKAIAGQNEYVRGQRLNKDFVILITNLKVGDVLEFQFDKSLWTVTNIKDDTVYATQIDKKDYAERSIGTKGVVRGYKLI